ncbi:DUF2255 family protein [Streptomyces sp. SID13726]|uniref:DUF2255 family protein n=1 Tax=Streptomyces sp. SID13726 TaxID=2706058 RepID=UPI0013BE778D|nr:DUF2255 family protein [Streptomyces sp. SID13726]NEA98960.1 DUF2255 family protein [Streptomyces sp. SID13726]
MTIWTNDELTRIEGAEELRISPLRSNGTPREPLPVWVVRDGDDLYVRSFRGGAGSWYRAARSSLAGRIRCGGVAKDVIFAEVPDTDVNDRIDAAYRTKYGRYGASYVDPLVAARDTTLKLVPAG